LYLAPRLLLPRFGVSSPFAALHPSQTVKEARRGPVDSLVGRDASPQLVESLIVGWWAPDIRTRLGRRTSGH
jgi:hypothetical protein